MCRRGLAGLAMVVGLAACGERAASGLDGAAVPLDRGWPAEALVDAAPPDHRPPDLPCTCKLAITRLNGKLVVGGSITVEVTTTCLPDGAKVSLTVTGLATQPVALVTNGKAVFDGVALSPLVLAVILRATAPGCTPGTYAFNVTPMPECFFIAPKNGATINAGPLQVKLGFLNAYGGSVSLRANGAAVGPPMATGGAFPPFNASPGTLLLEAEVVVPTGSTPLKSTCTATVMVSPPP